MIVQIHGRQLTGSLNVPVTAAKPECVGRVNASSGHSCWPTLITWSSE